MIAILFALTLLQVSLVKSQNACTATAVATCGRYTCVQTDTIFSCLCSNFQLASSQAACDLLVSSTPAATTLPTTTPSIILPNQCATANCPAGSTCIPTTSNPPLYICLCPGGVIGNPNCPTTSVTNPCLTNNPCLNGGTCTVNTLTSQAVCLCPANTYGPNCATYCRPACDSNWCYNGGRCANVYGYTYCSCPFNYRGRRCELRSDYYNYVYLYYPPQHYGK